MSRLGIITAALGLFGLTGCSEVEAHDRTRPRSVPANRPELELQAARTESATGPAAEARGGTDAEREFPRVRRAVPAVSGVSPQNSLTAAAAPEPAPQPIAPPKPPRVDLVVVDISDQRLDLVGGGRVLRSYSVSTAKNGTGSRAGSEKTPLGRHRIHKKIGAGEPLGRVFEARTATRRVATIHTAPIDLPEDVITSRILWLEGLEQGQNRGRGVDSRERFIYIHGTNEEGLIGSPASHGCVRMRNLDVIELFELVAEGTTVEIVP